MVVHILRQKNIHQVATALTACGIETFKDFFIREAGVVATALTACGIETLLEILEHNCKDL